MLINIFDHQIRFCSFKNKYFALENMTYFQDSITDTNMINITIIDALINLKLNNLVNKSMIFYVPSN